MINIIIPSNNIEERKYLLDVVFKQFLGIHYNVENSNVDEYQIFIGKDKSIIIKDSFFSNIRKFRIFECQCYSSKSYLFFHPLFMET